MADPVDRLNAALEGRYRIERPLGEGGMATVWLARDLKHNRNVALKVLRPELAAVVGAERFLTEIETTANLQHPHILPLFDSGEADGFLFYVMPYVEGESLREKLDRERQLPVDEAIRITTNIAEALDYAHRHGVIHRDIKPANILLQDGKPVVSDFGIALAVTAGGAGRLTETGLSLGTPHYMSPEQATGDVGVGGGSDIYALGCVLYEMLVGEPPYTGSTPQAILGKIIQAKPVSATEMRRTVPENVDAAVRKALEKVPADRFRSAKELSDALADPAFRHGGAPGAAKVASAGPARPWNRLTVAFGALAAVLVVVSGVLLLRPAPAAAPAAVRRFVLEVPGGSVLRPSTAQPLVITPDGEAVIANLTDSAVGNRLYQRALGDLEMAPIRGTEGVGSFMISPDGAWIAFNDIRAAPAWVKMPAEGGPTSTLAQTPGSNGGFRGASWGDAGTIVYGSGAYLGLLSVRDVGGLPDTLTRPEEGVEHRSPKVLPGGRTVLFEVSRSGEDPQIAALSVATGVFDTLTQGQDPDYVAGGFLLFRRGNAIWAARLDPEARRLEGEPVPVLEGMQSGRFYSVSNNGTLVYATGSNAASGLGRLTVVDMNGNRQTLPLAGRSIQQVGWSPDGESVVFGSDQEIYTYDVVLNSTPRQITFEGSKNEAPVYSPDGKKIVFSSQRDGTDGSDLFVKDLESDEPPKLLIRLDANQFPVQWPQDTLIVFERGENNVADLWTVDISDPEHPEAQPYLTSEYNLERIVLSPDGRFAAYQSNESGTTEVYIRSFPTPGARTVVSRGGGGDPEWSPDGSTIYYFTGPGNPPVAARLRLGTVPTVLSFDTLSFRESLTAEPYPGALHPDGDRFIFSIADDAGAGNGGTSEPQRIVLVQNFVEQLKQLLPE